eukprot:GHVT01053004.1.p2 GENE.GHVT01053004.1~~GHVT01053004.1.p2  ORF type:complete len:129 (-),score=12.36 GHVT01053004.1:452-838(-)
MATVFEETELSSSHFGFPHGKQRKKFVTTCWQFLGLCLITIHHAITPQKEEEARKSDRQAQCLPTACPLLRPTAGHAGQNANNKKVDMTNATGDFREIPLAEYLFEIIGWLQGCCTSNSSRTASRRQT